jgi:hypothetical protein
MSATPTGRAAGATTVGERATALVQACAALAIAAAFAFMAVRGYQQIERLIWRPEEILRMLSAAASLVTDYPGRFAGLVLGSVALMSAAEYRPRAVLDGSVAIWLGLGGVGTGAYLLSALDLGTRWALAVLLAAGAAATVVALARALRRARTSESRAQRRGSSANTRPVLPIVIGLIGGLLAVRASIEPVTEWDAVVYHVSFARDWIGSLPGLPHAAGPSVGGELSYNYPALFPSISVALAGALHLSVSAVARLVSPLAALTLFAVLRALRPASPLPGWAPSMFLLGSTFFVAYGQWPTAYMLMTLLVVLAVARLVVDRRLTSATALCIGLVAGTGLIGVVFALIIVVAYLGWRLDRRRFRALAALSGASALQAREVVLKAALLTLPLGVVVVASLRQTGGLFFPWATWPHAGRLLPEPYWSTTKREILVNSYGQFDATAGSFFKPLFGIARSGLLAPGGLALQGLIVAACGVAFARGRRALLTGAAAVAGILILLVALQLVWLRYFVPMSVAAAVGLGVAMSALRDRSGGRVALLAYTGAVVAACVSIVSGVAYALAGPNDRTYTAKTEYRLQRYSAFESASAASAGQQRRGLVYGDDARAWDDINHLDASGFSVGTFDIRNYYSSYVRRLQLDGLAGAAITGKTGSSVARQLKARGIDAVFIPSWFWEPGAARHPLAGRSPVVLWVGAPNLRALRVYLPDEGVSYPSVLYAVGPSAVAKRRVGSLLRSSTFSVEGPPSSRRTAVPGGFRISGVLGGPLHWRIAAPVTEAGGPSLRLTTKNVAAVRGASVFEPRVPTLVQPAAFVDCTGVAEWARTSTVDVAFPGSPLGFASLDVGVARGTRSIQALVRSLPSVSAKPLVRACGDPTSARGGVFPVGSIAGRIVAERGARPLALSFDYLDAGRGPVSFNVYDGVHSRWLYSVAGVDRCGSGTWLRAQLPLRQLHLPPSAGRTVELGPFVTGDNFTVRNLRLVRGSTRRTPRC